MKPKYITAFLIMISISVFTNGFGQNVVGPGSSILGKWVAHDGRVVVEMFKEQESYIGKIDSLLDLALAEELVGLTILKDFTLERNKFVGGTIYDPESEGTYECELRLKNNETLKVRDYCGMFYKTFTWTRLK